MEIDNKTDEMPPTTTTATAKTTNITKHRKHHKQQNFAWYLAPGFLTFWLVLFFAIVRPMHFHLPTGLTLEDAATTPEAFIAERAERILADFDAIGTKVLGSYGKENRTLQLLLDEVEKIRRVMHTDLFQLEVDVQRVSGNFQHFAMVNMYRGVQNLAVKFSAKNSADSQAYLLVNSHYDSKPGSSAAGDDGTMVVVMLEVLRVLATTRRQLSHPIVFLFNGAEENGLQGSHGFITQHRWASKCRAVINLDSAGSGHKELLFQTTTNYPWIMKYYSQHIVHPYATTAAEELFEANIMPSDSDFRIWKNFGKLPGLDFAHTHNGYIYHTRFDKANIIPRGTFQNTGDNILSLARSLADAPELINPKKQHHSGHAVFFDFVGLFFVYYTESQARILNLCVCLAAKTLIGISIWRLASTASLTVRRVTCVFALIFSLHVIGFILSFVLPLLVAVLLDSVNHSMSWFTHTWFVLGLYACPSAFGLLAPTLLLMNFSRCDKLSQSFKLHLVLHSHCIILTVLCLLGTFFGIRTSYLLLISILFYLCSMVINFITNLHQRGYYWILPLIFSQMLPFLYLTYLSHFFLFTLIPVMGRSGSGNNPDLKIAALTALGTVLAMGFLIPILSIFRKPKTILFSLLAITLIFFIIALTPLGFPYRPKTNVGRVQTFHVRRVFYEYDKSISRDETGYLFEFMDRRKQDPFQAAVNFTAMSSIANYCKKFMMCGLPVLYRRWNQTRLQNVWLPTTSARQQLKPPKLTLLSVTTNATTLRTRFEFQLETLGYMGLYFQALDRAKISDWSFVKDLLQTPSKYQPPYHVHITTGVETEPLNFHIDLETKDNEIQRPLFKLGVYTHFVNSDHNYECEKFIKKFPVYLDVMCWPTSYERYIF